MNILKLNATLNWEKEVEILKTLIKFLNNYFTHLNIISFSKIPKVIFFYNFLKFWRY